MRATVFVLLCLILSLPAVALGAQPQFLDATGADNFKVYWIVRAKQPPKLDGKLQEAVWKRAPVIRDWGITNYGRQKGAVGDMEARFAWDEDYLYVAFTCRHPRRPEDMAVLRENVADTSKPIYTRECVELHIDGNLDHVTRYQVWFNPIGEKMLFWHYDFGWGLLVNQDYGLNADWGYEPLIGEDFWQVEGRIALADLQVEPRIGYMFALNPCWFNWADTREPLEPGKPNPPRYWQFVTWSTQGESHHDVRKYGRVILVDKKPESLEAGLRLAFPDLDKRTVMIQTTDRFLTFVKGKAREESFIDKARVEVAEVRKQWRRLKEAAEKSRINNSWRDKAVTETAGALDELEKELKGQKSITVAKLNQIREELGALHGRIDNVYWRTRQEVLLSSLPAKDEKK